MSNNIDEMFSYLTGRKKAEEKLAHFGVRGMRWGVRKKSGSSKSGDTSKKTENKKDADSEAQKKPAAKKTDEPDAPPAKKTSNKKSNVDDLSDAQLREAVNRLQMEKQYRDLTAMPPGRMQAAKKFANEAIRQVAMTQVVKIGNSHAAKLTGGLLAKPDPKAAQATIDSAKKLVTNATKAAT
jgi:hypothetical protein